MWWFGALVIALALLPLPAKGKTSPTCGAPAAMSDGWPVAAPEKEGLDPKVICAIGPVLEKLPDADPNGVVVARHGVLVYEHYFTGWDWHWGSPAAYEPHDADTLHDLHSISKSVVALLTGIAFDRGWLRDIDAPVLSFFPNYADLRGPDKNRITVRDLLTMTSGLAWPELGGSSGNPSNPFRGMFEARDPYRFVLQQPIAATPGTLWDYDSGGVELLGMILKKVAKQPVDQFARQALFEPLGIRHWEWAQFANGSPIASAGLRLRPRDLAKIGQLVLDHGIWHGQQIVSAGWIKQMTAPHSPKALRFDYGAAYGYLWWLGRAVLESGDIDWVGGLGYGGQRLYVVPSEDLIVAVTAGVFRRSYAQSLAGTTALEMALRATIAH
jgi:CubicO group peptidase (beta-lactamase class C family)